MIRNLKVLGLALAAVFALSAAFAASAFAETDAVITNEGSIASTLDGTEIGTGQNFFEAAGIKVECPGSSLNGHEVTTTPHAAVPNGASVITVTPEYRNCNHEVHMNGCDFDLKEARTTGGVAGTYGVKAQITCPVGQHIVVTLSPCNSVIGPQTVTGFHVTNTAGSPDDLVLSGIANVATTACGIPVTAEQHQNVTIQGTNAAGTGFIGVTLTHN